MCSNLKESLRRNYLSFLDSEYVRAGLVEINEIQEDIYSDMMKFPQMTTEEKYEHVSKLEVLGETKDYVHSGL